jgi:Recombination endonuclease VII
VEKDRSAYFLEWQRKNKDKVAAANKKWRDKHRNEEDRKAAANERSKEWYKNNKERATAATARWREKNREKLRKQALERYYALGHIGRKKKDLWDRYKLTVEQYESMLAACNGFCPVCSRAFGKKPHVDHCHKTGRVRGILCFRCNNAEGLIGTSEACLKLYEYMKLHEGQL